MGRVRVVVVSAAAVMTRTSIVRVIIARLSTYMGGGRVGSGTGTGCLAAATCACTDVYIVLHLPHTIVHSTQTGLEFLTPPHGANLFDL